MSEECLLRIVARRSQGMVRNNSQPILTKPWTKVLERRQQMSALLRLSSVSQGQSCLAFGSMACLARESPQWQLCCGLSCRSAFLLTGELIDLMRQLREALLLLLGPLPLSLAEAPLCRPVQLARPVAAPTS